MFKGCNSLIYIDLSIYDNKCVKNKSIFDGCNSLIYINISNLV